MKIQSPITENNTSSLYKPSFVVARSVGDWYSQNGNTANTNNHGMTAAGTMRVIPVYLHAGNLDAIGVYITVTAVSTWRLGMYPADPVTRLPTGQTLAFDAGTLNMSTSTGQRSISISYAMPSSNLVWLAGMVDAYTAVPTVQGWDNNGASAVPPATGVPIQFDSNGKFPIVGRFVTGLATGSLPSTCPTLTGWTPIAPRFAVRAAT